MVIYVTEKDNLIAISPVYIQSKYGTCEKTKLFIERKEMNVESVLYWRKKPKVFVTFSSIKKIARHFDKPNRSSTFKSRSQDTVSTLKSVNSLSTDCYDAPEEEESQKLAFYFTQQQPNDFKVVIDFSCTKPKEYRTPFSRGESKADLANPNEDENVAGSDTTSNTDEGADAFNTTFYHENSFEDFENDNDANVNDKIYTIEELLDLFHELHTKSMKIAHLDLHHHHPSSTGAPSSPESSRTVDIILKQEQLLQLNNHFKTQEAMIILNNFMNRYIHRKLAKAFFQWIGKVKESHDEDMRKDRHRWRLHAAANQELDLQAWYHALFYQEVYRLRGNFWYKDAVLPAYKQSYDLVDNALTPLEEAALAHVLCSPDTSYGDVAGQMFIVQSILPPRLFTLFQQLASQGAQIVKYPRQGRPAKKLFRFSFVDGNIYLTWKGKFGNQGVGMYEVTGITTGLQTEVLKWSGQSSKAEQYLSLLCADRSVDLLFETEEERNNWKELLTVLMTKEQGYLPGIEPMDPHSDFDGLILYSSIGKKIHR